MRSYERHQLKKDRFASTTAETLTWASEHRNNLVRIGIIAGVAVLVIAGVMWFLRHREQQASAALSAALETYNAPVRAEGAPPESQVKFYTSDKERAKAASAAFRHVADKYSHSRSGQMARYFVGLSEQEQGNSSEAEKQLKEAADSGNSDIAAMAKFALASLYRNSNRPADAVKTYKDLVEHPAATVPKTTAQLELAELYSATQQPKEAVKIYEQVSKDNPQSLAAQIAVSKRQQLQPTANQQLQPAAK